jgi:pyrimidine-nucleoside phosphorylase
MGVAIEEILSAHRDGLPLSDAQVSSFVAGVVSGDVSRPQAAAFLAFTAVRGLGESQMVALTRAMVDSGDRLRWPAGPGLLIDKHSTGGVGDKVSLVLAPLWAALGHRVPMISGRGLEHTGGTLDKLESIPGFRVDLGQAALARALETAGCFISGQTAALAPADRILYALRNETSTVPSIPLIVASILSKKLAEGIDRLVLDVKFGSGAFMKTRADAAALAAALERVGTGAGVPTTAHLTPMDAPLGRAVGNAVEVAEAIDCLRGGGPADLRALVLRLAGHPEAEAALDDGRAYARFCAMVRAQGGDPEAPLHGAGTVDAAVGAPQTGRVVGVDAYRIGRAAFLLGAGRRRAEDPVHPGVGVLLDVSVGDTVERGGRLCVLRHAGGAGLAEALALAEGAFTLAES